MRFTRLKLNGFKSFVDPTDLVIADGLTGVVGPNGAGKTTLLNVISGFVKPVAGSVKDSTAAVAVYPVG